MSLTVNAYDLRAALTKIKPALGNTGSLPILAGVRCTPLGHGRLELVGTNLEVNIAAEIAMKGRKGKAFVLPFALVHAICSTVKAPAKATRRNPNPTPAPDAVITIEATGDGPDRATLVIGDRTTTFDLLPADEFPRLNARPDLGGIKGTLQPMADVMFAASRDDCQPILTCVHVDSGVAVATDSYRLALSRAMPDLGSDAPDGGMLIPGYAVRLAVKLGGEPVMHWDDRQVQWSWDNGVTVIARLCEGEFPRYQNLIANCETAGTVTFPCADTLSKHLRSLRRTAPSMGHPVRITAEDNTVHLAVGNPSDTEDRIVMPGATYDNPGIYAFNPAFLADVVTGLDGPGVTLNAHPQKPTTVTEGDLTRLIMSVRIS